MHRDPVSVERSDRRPVLFSPVCSVSFLRSVADAPSARNRSFRRGRVTGDSGGSISSAIVGVKTRCLSAGEIVSSGSGDSWTPRSKSAEGVAVSRRARLAPFWPANGPETGVFMDEEETPRARRDFKGLTRGSAVVSRQSGELLRRSLRGFGGLSGRRTERREGRDRRAIVPGDSLGHCCGELDLVGIGRVRS